MKNPKTRTQVEEIIHFILTPEYQSLPEGYGIVLHDKRYYAMGWDIKLPRFHQEPKDRQIALMLLRMQLLKKTKTGRESVWFKNSLQTLENHRIKDNLIHLTVEELPEKQTGVWVLGARMALTHGRRTKQTLATEATFRTEIIKNT